MVEQTDDLRDEGRALQALLAGLEESDWARQTPFKNWTVNQVVAHLHGTDSVCVSALEDPEAFRARQRERRQLGQGGPGRQGGGQAVGPTGPELLARWHDYFLQMCDLLDVLDPAVRVPWFGPDMSVRMMATARQMETWAHGQDVYDLLRVRRENTDRIRNIAFIGVRTYGFTFANRGLESPGEPPYVELVAPSGAVWQWNEPDHDNCVVGSAVEFCHVVTQGRNIAEVSLDVRGEPATRWMAIAQCFAGPPQNPPAAGVRGWF